MSRPNNFPAYMKKEVARCDRPDEHDPVVGIPRCPRCAGVERSGQIHYENGKASFSEAFTEQGRARQRAWARGETSG